VTEFLLSKGIPVDIDYGSGTALLQAAINEQDKTVKILLDRQANVYIALICIISFFQELIWIGSPWSIYSPWSIRFSK
jgi:ankyrin repeat protein